MNEEMPRPEESNSKPAAQASFWAELKRRKVMRVAVTYGVVMWLLIQVAATVFPQLGMPEWAPRLVTLLLLIGFPVAIVLAWAFELTPDGIRKPTTLVKREVMNLFPKNTYENETGRPLVSQWGLPC